MRLFHVPSGVLVETADGWFRLTAGWDDVVNRDDLEEWVTSQIAAATLIDGAPDLSRVLPPVKSQEVWAAGVTYYRSRTARMEESKSAGGGDFYDRVYEAARPELFFKATPSRVRGHGQPVRIRKDSTWNVPEPELALYVNASGAIVGYTIGNDMSSRDIEGENPLYLPQAKVYDGSCGLGPALFVSSSPLPSDTEIRLVIRRGRATAFEGFHHPGVTEAHPFRAGRYLYRDNTFPNGCVLLTGTGVVPPDEFTLAGGDEIAITIGAIGTLVNVVE